MLILDTKTKTFKAESYYSGESIDPYKGWDIKLISLPLPGATIKIKIQKDREELLVEVSPEEPKGYKIVYDIIDELEFKRNK